ncbi:hypothetical protein TcasGA2_TC004477 [Tribolium castaneum]|uniref:Uncharacterized protein n=1 Tax=Tribolium castaneum TaxID=7070 RepID=D6WCI6_TRICA|nr:hypothetical protein TcasGA2_TC004477 [Tribolium castaneum]
MLVGQKGGTDVIVGLYILPSLSRLSYDSQLAEKCSPYRQLIVYGSLRGGRKISSARTAISNAG